MTNPTPQNTALRYYDSDYPSEHFSDHAENFDDTTVAQGLRHDVTRYLEIAAEVDGEILELCCGTGRVAMPLAARIERVDPHVGVVGIPGFRQIVRFESFVDLVEQVVELIMCRLDGGLGFALASFGVPVAVGERHGFFEAHVCVVKATEE